MKQLENKIRNYIEQNGPVNFEKFMDFALYDTEYGYYTRNINGIGKSGDFYTSPAVHNAFGKTISNFILKCSTEINSSDFAIVELGSGQGYLAMDILDNLRDKHAGLYETITYYCIDKSGCNSDFSQNLLCNHKSRVRYLNNMTGLERSIRGIFISNEFFDSIPFRRFKFLNGKPYEILVTATGNDFTEILEEVGDDVLKKKMYDFSSHLAEGQQFEINTRMEDIIRNISGALVSGFILTFDYGYLQQELYNPERFSGTYRCFYNHTISENPYINIGLQDITCSIDFSSIINSGEKFGFRTMKYITQGQFLVDWGILDIIDKSPEIERAGIKNLMLPQTMGDKFKALLQYKNLKFQDSEFYPESEFRISYQSINDRLDDF